MSQGKKKEQEVDIIEHQVKLGESVRLLSKKYLVDPAEIYKLNKFAVEGIQEGMVLKIPVPRKNGVPAKEVVTRTQDNAVENAVGNDNKSESKVIQQNAGNDNKSVETVVEQKTEYKQPEVSEKGNATDIKQIIITEDKTEINHKVLPKETLYSLARTYNVSVDDIKANNPAVAQNGLQIGQVVRILTGKKVEVKQSSTIIKQIPKTASAPAVSQTPKSEGGRQVIKHTVMPKETLYSLSKKYNVTVDQIKEQNASLLINGLQIGQVLEIKPNN